MVHDNALNNSTCDKSRILAEITLHSVCASRPYFTVNPYHGKFIPTSCRKVYLCVLSISKLFPCALPSVDISVDGINIT